MDGETPTRIGGYEILAEIARGGMGIVYKARQPGLDRVVALKVIVAGEHASLETIERFQREARAAAKLEHPNVVEIYDVGQDGPCHFFTMQLVEGASAAALARDRRLSHRQAAEIARKTALALDAAHAHGILHRDVKPANILIDADGEPHLADFGLAKDIAAGPFTATGASIGTPAYAPPEQVAGQRDRIGPQSDVYSLGASLYEMLTGRPPHTGASVFAILTSVLYEEPPSLRSIDPSIPSDLDTITLTALDKSLEHRYASARAFGDDLGRFLAGEAISARPVSTVARWGRAASRSRGPLLALGACIAIGASAVAWGIHRRTAVARDLAEAVSAAATDEREGTRDSLVRARDRLLGARKLDPSAAADALARVEARLAEIDAVEDRRREAAARAGRAAEETLKKAERVAAVLSRWKRLAPTLARMEASGYDSRLSMEEIRLSAAEPFAEVERFARETPDDPASRAAMLAFRGWAEFLAGRLEEAPATLRAAQQADPDVPYGLLVEAFRGFAWYAEEQALPAVTLEAEGPVLGRSIPETAEMASMRESIEALLDRARHARVWGKDAAADLAAALDAVRAIQSAEYARAEAGLSQALASPDLASFATALLLARAKVRYLTMDFERGLADAAEVVRARPSSAYPRYFLAHLRLGRAATMAGRGEDPRGTLKEAIEACCEGLALKPGYDQALHERAMAWQSFALAEGGRGTDPRGSLAKAIADFEAVIAFQPDSATAWSNLAGAHRSVGDAAEDRGEDPREAYGRAVDACDHALRLDPSNALTLVSRAGARFRAGEHEAGLGIDPRKEYDLAIADCTEALRIDPLITDAWIGRANTWTRRGQAEDGLGLDGRDSYRRAIEDDSEAIARRPRLALAYAGRGGAWRDLAESEQAHGGNPLPCFEKSVADMDASLAINPSNADAHHGRGIALRLRGEAEKAAGKDPIGSLDESMRAFNEAIRLNPAAAEAWSDRGDVTIEIAQAQPKGADSGEAIRRATADYTEAIARNPKAWRAHMNRGQIEEAIGKLDEAAKDYEEAISVVGTGYAPLQEMLARVKGRR